MQARTKTLIHYTVPMILSSVCFFLYTIIDGIFVGNGVGLNALGAVNIAMPFLMIVNAFFLLTSIGGTTVTAIRLGRGDVPGANQAFLHALAATIVISALLMIAGVFFPGKLATLLGANATFHTMVRDYIFWYSVFLIPGGVAMIFQSFCRNDGSPGLMSASVIIATVLNVFGDWLTVFPLHLGIKGAAIATGVSQVASLAIVSLHFIRKKGQLRLSGFVPSRILFLKVFKRGLPELIAKFAAPLSTAYLNYVLIRTMGDIAVNAFSLLNYVASFSVAVFFGTADGLQPLYGRCYGAKNADDLKYYFRSGALINFVSSVVIFFLLFPVGRPIFKLFNADAVTINYTMRAMPEFAWCFCAIAISTVISAYFYSTKRTKEALVLNVFRSFIFNAPVIFLLPMAFGESIVWYTYGIAELLTAILAIAILKHSERKGIIFR